MFSCCFRTVNFNRIGIQKTTSKGDALLQAIPAVRAIIDSGRLLETRALGLFISETNDGTFHYDLRVNTEAAGSRPRGRRG